MSDRTKTSRTDEKHLNMARRAGRGVIGVRLNAAAASKRMKMASLGVGEPWGQTDLEFLVERILNRSDPKKIQGDKSV